jgi:uncharacterized membrane protein
MMQGHRHFKLPSWFIPALYASVAVAAGLALPRFESHVFPRLQSRINPAAAMAIYTSIGTGMLALTGIVFALMFLMIQFSATAYSPRLVLWIARDRVLWHALGMFTATFLYSIAAIAWLDRNETSRVPFFTAWFVIALLLASVGMFIALVERISLLQVNNMLTFTGDYGRSVIEKIYPSLDMPIATVQPDEFMRLPVTQTLVHAGRPQAIQALDISSLLTLASMAGGVIEVVSGVGDTAVHETLLLQLYGGKRQIDERLLRRAFVLGQERTFEQDPKLAIRLLVDIAIKALSPAINDPTTAVQALDEIEDLLLRLGRKRFEIGAIRNKDGALRLVLPNPTWEDFLSLAFDEIRFCGATSIQVMRRMKALIGALIAALPPERRNALWHHQDRLDATIAKTFEDAEEKREASVGDRQGLGVPLKRRNGVQTQTSEQSVLQDLR